MDAPGWPAKFPRSRFLLCPNGGHIAMYDDQQAYFAGLLQWLHKVNAAAVATP
jgi:proline iminopeptidase